MNQYNNHKSVLKIEAIDTLNIKENNIYVDCTAGRGGHIDQILKKNKNNIVIAIDKDLDAIDFLKEKYKSQKNVHVVYDDFKNITSILEKNNINKVDGFLFDLGVSSPQLDNPTRGFSYKHDSFLDMRMNQNEKLTAYEIVNNYPLDDLVNIFKKYGEMKNASIVAKKIVECRAKKDIKTTLELVNIIKTVCSGNASKHPARLVFQALRIEVNKELEGLDSTIITCFDRLNDNGVIAIITFHSLEDKIVKTTFHNLINKNNLPSYIPIAGTNDKSYTKSIKPSKEETIYNNRARSAKLRILVKRGE